MTELMREMAALRPESASPPVDQLIARLAERQHGAVARRQLAALGLTDPAIAHRRAAGRLHRIHHGVYAVGHPVLGERGRWMAAALACGPRAALSHASAAALWALRANGAAFTDVTVPGVGGRRRPRLRIHRARDLRPDEVTTHHGIPVTTPARTLLDLAAALSPRNLDRVLDRTEILELADHPSLAALAAAHPGHRGAGRLERALTEHHAGTTLTRSELEDRFLELCAAHGLPQPRANASLAGFEVDFLFATHRLVVETDGWAYHNTRRAFEEDRRRDAALTLAGYRTARFTHRRIAAEPHAVAATVRAAAGER